MTQMMIKKLTSYNQEDLQAISDILCDNIESVLHYFNIDDYKMCDKMVTMNCPIHGGDNKSAFNLYYTGDSYRGNWKCRTHQCEEIFKSSIIGFIRGCLSRNEYGWTNPGDTMASFKEAIKIAKKLSKYKADDRNVSSAIDKDKKTFVQVMGSVGISSVPNKQSDTKISPQQVRSMLQIPSKYFVDRGFSTEILNKYDIGECYNPKKEMHNRAVVPVYDIDHKSLIGCSGRSIFNKCPSCSCFHDPMSDCPSAEKQWLYSKWRHSSNFKTQNTLYNMWYAYPHIKQTSTAILVESPGNVWRLEESGIHTSLAIFGSNIADRQKMLLDMSGAMNLIVIMDNDKAGRDGYEKIYQKCYRTYNVYKIDIETNDIAEMSISEIKSMILPQIEKYYL